MDFFFCVPLALYDAGYASLLGKSACTRYGSLMRCSNYLYGARKFQAGPKQLEEMDGIAERTAKRVHARLEEYGLIRINRKTRPHTFQLIPPSEWPPCPLLDPKRSRKRTRTQDSLENGQLAPTAAELGFRASF